jgi:Fe2+ transport system protein FeoA
MKTLKDLQPGESGTIENLRGEGRTYQRLAEMGLTPGVPIRVVRVAPMGDPIEVRVRDYSLSIRKSDAANVLLASDPKNS